MPSSYPHPPDPARRRGAARVGPRRPGWHRTAHRSPVAPLGRRLRRVPLRRWLATSAVAMAAAALGAATAPGGVEGSGATGSGESAGGPEAADGAAPAGGPSVPEGRVAVAVPFDTGDAGALQHRRTHLLVAEATAVGARVVARDAPVVDGGDGWLRVAVEPDELRDVVAALGQGVIVVALLPA
jgi:hypothetical protein